MAQRVQHYQTAQQPWRQAPCTRDNGLGAARSYAATCIGGSVTLAQKVDRSGGAGQDWLILGAVVVVGIAAGFIPAWRGYRHSVADGMMVQNQCFRSILK